MSADPIYSADSIGRSFKNRTILKSASVWAWEGRVTALLGRNGSGKSTLMKIGAGVLRAHHGVVRFGAARYTNPRMHKLARQGLYYLADRSCLPLDTTLRRTLTIIEQHFGAHDAIDAAHALGLTHLLDTPVIELSGGELKRSEVAVAVARNPLCLMADEPFAGISPLDAEQITAAFRALCARGCAIILSGHEVPSILDLADEIVWVTAGTTHALGTPAQALTHHQFCREYLGRKTAT